MPVASYKYGPHVIGPKEIPAPKRADLYYWYKECRKVIPDLPPWREEFRSAEVDVEVIHFRIGQRGDLWIARKRRLR